MLTQEQNERLTRVGPGTPGGELLRRYWQPFAAAADLVDKQTKKVRVLGEDLALFRDRSGKLGLVAELCPHRRCSLAYGVPENDGIRCPYHGWLFDNAGNCLEQPAESPNSTFKNRIKTVAYPVQEVGGIFWTYMGPGEAPVFPKHDYLVQENTLRDIGLTMLPINWVQAMENSLDPTHLEWLHMWYGYYVNTGKSHTDLGTSLQIRCIVDDTHTLHMLYNTYHYDGVEAPKQDPVPTYEFPYLNDDGTFDVSIVLQQDMMAWVTQGAIADRTVEHVGASDRGVLLYRKIFDEQIRRVEAGEDPLGVYRDAAHDVEIRIPIDTVESAKEGLGMARRTGQTEQLLAREAAWMHNPDREQMLQVMNQGQNRFSPINEEIVELRMEYLKVRGVA